MTQLLTVEDNGARSAPLVIDVPRPYRGGLLGLTWVPLGQLRAQPDYQRDLRWEKLKRIAEQFDPRLLGAITVARYPDGRLGAGPADGRHRTEALALLFADETLLVPCFVVDVADEKEEARLFERLNMERATVNRSDVFRSRLVRDEPQAQAIVRVLERAGWSIEAGSSGSKAWNVLKSPVAVEKIWGQSPSDLLDVLEFINATWPDQADAKCEKTLLGVHHLLAYYHTQPAWDERRVREVLARIALRTLLRGVGGLSHGRRGEVVGDLMARVYNENRPKGAARLNVPVRGGTGEG